MESMESGVLLRVLCVSMLWLGKVRSAGFLLDFRA